MAAVLIGKEEGVVEFNGYRYWAERGMIHWENRDDGDYGTQSVAVTLVRLRGISDMVKNTVQEAHESGPKMYYHDEIEKHQQWLEEMVAICKQAQIQGQPSDPLAVRDLKRQRKKTVVMPGTRARF